MSPRFIRVTIVLAVVAILFGAAYFLVPKVGTGHPKINTAGKIIYLSDADSSGKPHVWIIRLDGTGATDLTPGQQSCADPSFSPDGSQIAYVSDKDGQQEVYIMDADGTNAHPVTIGSAAKGSPQFSPDGKTLTFLTQGTITALDLQSNDTTLILPSPSSATSSATSALIDVAHAPVVKYSWSPAGSASSGKEPAIAAVQESEDGDLQVFSVLPSLNGTPKTLVYAPSIGFGWQPDGSAVCVSILGGQAGPGKTFSGIVTFSSSGDPVQRAPVAVTNSSTLGPIDPVVSPDGSNVLFSVLNQPDLAHQQIIGLFIQPLDGSAAPREVVRGPAVGAQFSPDRTHVLLLVPSRTTGQHGLFVASLSGGSPPVDLTKGTGDVSSAQWSPTVPAAATPGQ